MRKIYSLLPLMLLTGLGIAQTLPDGLKYFSLEAPISDTQIVTAEATSLLDAQLRTHIAFIEHPDGQTPKIRYIMYDGEEVLQSTLISLPGDPQTVIAPNMALDASNNPHIVVIVKRDASVGTQSSNYAVFYAFSANQGQSFDTEQVSTNSTDLSSTTVNQFDCYVNGRPKVIRENGETWVYYHSNNFEGRRHAVLARKSGSAWVRSYEFTYRDEYGIADVTDDAFMTTLSGNLHFGWRTGDNSPRIAEKSTGYTVNKLEEYSNNGSNTNRIKGLQSIGQSVYFMFFNRKDNDKFIFIKYNGNGDYEQYKQFDLEYAYGGNLQPMTIDPLTSKAYGYYNRSFSTRRYLIRDDDQGNPEHIEFEGVGVIPGARVLNVRNNYLSLVLANFGANEIQIITGYLGEAATEETIPEFSANNTTITAGQSVQFQDESEGEIHSWNWTFEGGTPSGSDEQHPAIMYNEAGLYSVSLTVVDANGNEAIITKSNYITVEETASELEADFTVSETSPLVDEEITFTDQSSGNPVEWFWEFEGGEPATSIEQNPIVAYTQAGTYDVRLTVINDLGNSAELLKTDYITVNLDDGENAIADFSANSTAIAPGDQITFQNLSTGNAASLRWTFIGGEPSSSTDNQPDITYNREGVFNVSLRLFDENDQQISLEVKEGYISVSESNVASVLKPLEVDEARIYPNPTSTVLTLEWNEAKAIKRLTIHDISGKSLINYQPKEVHRQYQVSTNELPAGVYIIRVKIDNNEYFSRFIKQ